MAHVTKSVLVPYSAPEMYALVEDVCAYPEFLPWCAGARISGQTERALDATLEIRYRGVQQSFTTHNTLVPSERIEMQLREGPFSELSGCWSFRALGADGCKVELELHYAFSNVVLEGLVGPVFQHIATTFVDCFCRRAEALYGAKP